MAEVWYSQFETDDGLARQCRECGVTTWPASPDPERSAPIDHDPTCAVGAAERMTAERDALREAADALYRAFVNHRTATHKVKPHHCETCQEGDAAIDTYRALAAARGPAGSGED